MKAIIYAGIGLISVATVYGITDYYNAAKNGSINNLYNENPGTTNHPMKIIGAAITSPINNESELNEDNSDLKTTTRRSKNKKGIKLESFSRAIIAEEPDQLEEIKITEISKDPVVKNEVSTNVELKTVGTRKISLKQFSRAPLKLPVRKKKQ